MAPPPIIDISPLCRHADAASDGDDAAACIEAIHQACIDIGFFVATGHGLDGLLDDVFAAAHELFALPQPAKESLAMVDRRGFVPARHLVIDQTLHSAPMEYYDVGMGGENPWPPIDRFPTVVAEYEEAALSVAAVVLRALASALDLDPNFFADRMRDPECFLRMMHYEPHPPDDDGTPVVLTNPHTDYGLITLLATDGVGGLQVKPKGGEWTMVDAPPGSLVINLGDMLARWTNDRYVSTPHQVSSPPERDRYSVPFFVNPDPSAVVECLPSCVTPEQPCRYAPVTAGDFLQQRIASGGYMSDETRDL